jgi:hypothetical protein
VSWHRDENGLWCPCFQAYQPDEGTGCPAYPCPENESLAAVSPPQLRLEVNK